MVCLLVCFIIKGLQLVFTYHIYLSLSASRDRKRKKFVGDGGTQPKRIKTESGQWIKASYKTSAYQEWRERHKIDMPLAGTEEDTQAVPSKRQSRGKKGGQDGGRRKRGDKATAGDLKSKGEILKKRRVKKMQELARKRKAKKRQSTGASKHK